MADNQYVNAVEFNGQTLMDISGDTVTENDVMSGVTFHDRSGAPRTGSVITHNVYDGLDSSSAEDALSAKQGKALNDMILTLPVIKSFSVSPSSSKSFTVNNNSRIFVCLLAASDSSCGTLLINASSSGGINYAKQGASNVTLAKTTNSLTVTNASTGATLNLLCTIYNGNIT